MTEATLTETLRQRSTEQSAMTALMLKIKAEEVRWLAIESIGKKNEKEALLEANRYLTRATEQEILEVLQELEAIKGKRYASVQPTAYSATGSRVGQSPYRGSPFAGIVQTLLQGSISKAELAAWFDACKKTTFNSGNRYQPLPTHDEAWQTYSKVHSELYPKRLAAEAVKYRAPAVHLLDAEVIQAAKWGFWDDMSANLRRRLFVLLPQAKQRSIRQRDLQPEQAMQETRAHYDEMLEVYQ